MILQELYGYYERKAALGEALDESLVEKKIDFFIDIRSTGDSIHDIREKLAKSKKPIGKMYRVPSIGNQSSKHGNSGTDANLLWDNSSFVFGLDKNGNEAKAAKRLASFIETIERLYPEMPDDVRAVVRFLKDKNRISAIKQKALKDHPEIADGSAIISFRVDGDVPIFERHHVYEAVQRAKDASQKNAKRGVCLITGERDRPIALTHSVVKSVLGGQGAGCNMVSFNAPSFCSYGMEQGENSQVSMQAASRYVKALQMLIDSPKNKTMVGSDTVVAWAERDGSASEELDDLEDGWSAVFGDAPKDRPDEGVERIKGLLESIKTGRFEKVKGRFFVLGLSPNASRLAVRYWGAEPAKVFAERIGRHFDALEIVKRDDEPEYLSLNQLLRSTALESKITNVPPRLAGEVMRSILAGLPYPIDLLTAVLRRIRADRVLSRTRCAVIKAYLCGLREKGEAVSVSLNEEDMNIGYRLGRLFAVLERAQYLAIGSVNAGIRDRFYGAASTTPVTVFPRLLKLVGHHLSAIDGGGKVVLEKTIGAIMDGISEFPAHLTMHDQGKFAIGFYHQRQTFFTQKTKNTDGGDDND